MIPPTYTTPEAAAILHVSPQWIRDRVADGYITPLRLGRRYRLKPEHVKALARYLEPAEATPIHKPPRRRKAS